MSKTKIEWDDEVAENNFSVGQNILTLDKQANLQKIGNSILQSLVPMYKADLSRMKHPRLTIYNVYVTMFYKVGMLASYSILV